MSKWSKGIRKMLSAAGISFLIAANAMVMPLCASAATAVTDGVMIRNDASTEAGIIGSLNEGDEVTILDVVQSGDGYAWYYIELENGNTGYVRSDLLNASEEELKDFGGAPVNKEEEAAEEQKEETEAPAQETQEQAEAENSNAEAENSNAEAGTTQEAAPAAATGQTPAETSGDYDASKDPNAHFSVKYETEADGSGNWYVYNDDNGSRIKISDMKTAADNAGNAGGPGMWKPAAIIFGILTLALAAFALFLIKSIRDGRSKSSRRRSLEVAGYTPYEEDGEEEETEDEYYFTDDEESGDGEENTDSTIEVEVPQEEEPVELPSGDGSDAEISAVTDSLSRSVQDLTAEEAAEADREEADAASANDQDEADAAAAEKADETAETSIETATSDTDADAADMDPAAEKDSGSEPGHADETEAPDSDQDYADEDEAYPDEEEYEEEEDYEEDYDDEEYDDEDYEEDGDYSDGESTRVRSRGKESGGFFGFFKKVFGSDSKEDREDEGEDFDEEEHEFDEFSEYPEDVDLLPKEENTEDDLSDEDDFEEDDDAGSSNARGRLSMQRVMKNVGYKEEENDFSDSDPVEDDEDLAESLYDDDDDMSFSFIGTSRKK